MLFSSSSYSELPISSSRQMSQTSNGEEFDITLSKQLGIDILLSSKRAIGIILNLDKQKSVTLDITLNL